jgi:pheromone shutdown-related protein TraB
VEEVKRVIHEVRPDTVCVELDQGRYEALIDETRWQKLDIFQVIREGKVLFLLTSLALTAFQRKLGARVGVKPGSELLAAVKSCEEVGAELVLADRDIQATLKRTWANVSFWQKAKLTAGLIEAPFAVQEITPEQIEELKERDTINEMLAEFARLIPGIKEPLIDERDLYLMSKIQEAPGKTIVAVIGAGHVEGVLSHLGDQVDREALSKLPPPSLLSRVLKWLIPAIVLGAFYYGYSEHSSVGLKELVLAWVLPTSILAAVFTAAAGAKVPTIIAAFLASPFTTLNPTISAGMVTGLCEAWLRKPTVADCETVTEAVSSVKGVYQNRFTRVLLVVVLSTIGAALGAWVGTGWVVSLL